MLNNDPKILEAYSTDASLFKVMPKYVATPKSVEEVKELVKYAIDHGESLTPRAAGTDMSGGPLSESIVVDVTKMNEFSIEGDKAIVQPGVFYRDFEKKTLEKGLLLPCYPASKSLCALGGMIGNNCGGEKSLRYGKMENFIIESKWVFEDGQEHKISRGPLDNKYVKQVFDLIQENRELIEKARPKVSKNSAGYYLWNLLEDFDLNKLLVGSQGTLGIMTEATLRLQKVKPYHDMIALFFKSWDELPKVVNAILPHEPESLETFDKDTIKLGMKFMPWTFATKFWPEMLIGIEMLGLPELVILVEVAEESEREVKEKVKAITESIKEFKVWKRVAEKDSEEETFWKVRRESFNLLRKNSGNKRTVPLVDDFCIVPERVPEFLPKAKEILLKHGIEVNIAGHAGDGNFHIIPIMDLRVAAEREKLWPVAEEFYDLVHQFEGTITGEHNDGIVRTPFLGKMYSPEVLELFKKVKEIFDPKNIFNPGKKVAITIEYWQSHISVL